MATGKEIRFKVGGIQPVYQAGSFKTLTGNNPMGAEVFNKGLDGGSLLGAITSALKTLEQFQLSKGDLLNSLLSALGVSLSDSLGKLLNELVNGLNGNMLALIQARINRLMPYLGKGSPLCGFSFNIFEFKFNDMNIILAGFIGLTYDLCDKGLLGKLLEGIPDKEDRQAILGLLLTDLLHSNNTDLLIDIINNPDAQGMANSNIGLLGTIGESYTGYNNGPRVNYVTNLIINNNNTPVFIPKTPVEVSLTNGNTYNGYTDIACGILLVNGIKNILGDDTDIDNLNVRFLTDGFKDDLGKGIIDKTQAEIIASAANSATSWETILYIKCLAFIEIPVKGIENADANDLSIDDYIKSLHHKGVKGFCTPLPKADESAYITPSTLILE